MTPKTSLTSAEKQRRFVAAKRAFGEVSTNRRRS